MSPQCLPPSFSLILLNVLEQMPFQAFQDGYHLGYWNRINLAFQNLHVTPMPCTEFGLNQIYRSGTNMVWKVSRWPPWQPSWISEGMILAILNLYVALMPPIKFQLKVWEEMSFEDFQESHLGYRNGMSLAILNLHVAPMPPTKFGLNLTGFGSRCSFKILKILDSRMEIF